eukprot:TRINITY_DN7384_c0_g1_i1.p1 TRINITY_DN7384_c0_g1~~TRINITY_DN7384_c0_g1_i1.p1  ORF type:complete len:325 (-),score=58.58 TRINITY_DN7384_c0_g1_i1:54-977(-)
MTNLPKGQQWCIFTVLVIVMVTNVDAAPKRYLYYGTNYKALHTNIGKVNDGHLNRYDLATGESVVLAKDPHGIIAIALNKNYSHIYYLTSFPTLLKRLPADGSQEPISIRNFTDPIDTIETYNPLMHMRIVDEKIYVSEGGAYRGCSCIWSTNLDGLWKTGEVERTRLSRGFDVLPNGKVYGCGSDRQVKYGGDGIEPGFIDVTNTSNIVNAIAVSPKQEYVFYGGGVPLSRSKLDGSEMTELKSATETGYPRYLAVDDDRKRIYWVTTSRKYRTADFNGNGMDTVFEEDNHDTRYPPYCWGLALGE